MKLINFLLNNMRRTMKQAQPPTLILKTADKEALSVAVELLRSGKVIALPTDTIYGLACIANNSDAVKKLYDIKGRNEEKPVAICVGHYEDVKRYGRVPQELSMELLEKLLPGPVTIVLKKSESLNNPYLNPGTSKIGIRIPNCTFIQNLCQELNEPIALTSANRSSEPSSLNIYEFQNLWPSLAAVIDGGALSNTEEQRKGSTVMDLSKMPSCKIIREGTSYEETKMLLESHNIILEWTINDKIS